MITNFEYMSNKFFINKVIGKVTLSFTPYPFSFSPYPLFQWYLQSNENLLNLNVREKLYSLRTFFSHYNSCTCRSSENICSSSGGPQKKERGDETQFTTKVGGETSLGPSYFVLYNFIPSYAFDALLCRNWPTPNSLTLRITLMNKQ